MKAGWMLGFALALAACGGDENTSGAAVLGPDGELTEVSTLDLTTADGETFVVDLRDDGTVPGDVSVNTHRGLFTLRAWVNDVAAGHNLATITSDDNTLIVVGTAADNASSEGAAETAHAARETVRGQAGCPEQCIHCPQDNVFLCQGLCGMTVH